MAILSGGTQYYGGGKDTYGAIILPYTPKIFTPIVDPKSKTSLMGKLKSGLKKAPSTIKNAIKNPSQTFKKMAKYVKDNRTEMINFATNLELTSKFSGIAVAQALVNGKVTSKEALDYLFMGFAPALGVTASAMGYSGIVQMKDALFNGSIDVGGLVSGFTKAQKSIVDLKDQLKGKTSQSKGNVIEFDLTISHSESYTSETPDRRVENGNTLSETVHNLPPTFDVSVALQDGKRYTHGEIRAIFTELREKKVPIKLALGDEIFEDLILTGFNPTNDCTKSGMDYNLSFKQITIGYVDLTQEIVIQELPMSMQDTTKTTSIGGIGGIGGIGSGSEKLPTPNIKGALNSYIKEVSDIVTMKNGKTYVYSTLEDLGVIK